MCCLFTLLDLPFNGQTMSRLLPASFRNLLKIMPDRKIDTYQEISPLEVIFSTATTDPPGERLYSSQSAHFQKLRMQLLVSLKSKIKWTLLTKA